MATVGNDDYCVSSLIHGKMPHNLFIFNHLPFPCPSLLIYSISCRLLSVTLLFMTPSLTKAYTSSTSRSGRQISLQPKLSKAHFLLSLTIPQYFTSIASHRSIWNGLILAALPFNSMVGRKTAIRTQLDQE